MGSDQVAGGGGLTSACALQTACGQGDRASHHRPAHKGVVGLQPAIGSRRAPGFLLARRRIEPGDTPQAAQQVVVAPTSALNPLPHWDGFGQHVACGLAVTTFSLSQSLQACCRQSIRRFARRHPIAPNAPAPTTNTNPAISGHPLLARRLRASNAAANTFPITSTNVQSSNSLEAHPTQTRRGSASPHTTAHFNPLPNHLTHTNSGSFLRTFPNSPPLC